MQANYKTYFASWVSLSEVMSKALIQERLRKEFVKFLHIIYSIFFVDHLNEFNMVTNQLSSVGVNFDDEVRALLILSSFL